METNKILEALIAHPGVSAKRLAELSGANRNTVETVLQRHQNAIEASPSSAEGRRGRPEHLYQIKPEWVGPLQARWADEPRDGLERALAVLEAASFAAVDPIEPAEERVRMAEMARLRARAARALLEIAATDEIRREAASRIERAESRLTPPVPAEPRSSEVLEPADALLGWRRFWAQTEKAHGTGPAIIGVGGTGAYLIDAVAPAGSQGGPVPAGLRSWWVHWARQMSGLAEQFGGVYSGPTDVDHQGLALVLDCVPRGDDPMPAHLVEALDALRKPTLRLRMADLPRPDRTAFMVGFRDLALNPIARLADLYVTVDSRSETSRAVWSGIEALARPDHADHAVMVAQTALRGAVKHAGADPKMLGLATLYCTDFVTQVLETKQQRKGLWSLYGTPQVLDTWSDMAFGASCMTHDWAYHGKPGMKDMRGIAGARMGHEAVGYPKPGYPQAGQIKLSH